MKPWHDKNDGMNSSTWWTGKDCIDCTNPAGTAWSHLWCQECNAKRMDRLDKDFDNIQKLISKPTPDKKDE